MLLRRFIAISFPTSVTGLFASVLFKSTILLYISGIVGGALLIVALIMFVKTVWD